MGSQDLCQRRILCCSDSSDRREHMVFLHPGPVYTNLTESYDRCGLLPSCSTLGWASGYIILVPDWNLFSELHRMKLAFTRCECWRLWNEMKRPPSGGLGNVDLGPNIVLKRNSWTKRQPQLYRSQSIKTAAFNHCKIYLYIYIFIYIFRKGIEMIKQGINWNFFRIEDVSKTSIKIKYKGPGMRKKMRGGRTSWFSWIKSINREEVNCTFVFFSFWTDAASGTISPET